ncbi:RagB/SusD family nutrient uptake outer membrane protein [Sphingobacteriaceae bacterium GW460-11-11-14-LB5]|nr:RagB/SusD family nutrient uptake outer membrane protein [Sphingobacteriaceae bacterium GW460-11-11-14-LB5]
MKKYIYSLSIVILLTGSISCRKQLDTTPLDSFANETFWTTPQNVLIALTGVYRGNIQMLTIPATDVEFNPTDWWSYNGLLFTEFATDNVYDRRGDNSAYNTLTNGALTNSNANLSQVWNFSYGKIARCNYFLENISKATSLDAKLLKRYMAEVRFIRACQYFYLSQHFGSVPLVTKVLTKEEANTVKKASVLEVQNYVESELKTVIPDLPKYGAIPASEKGRASAQVAMAFLGRLYMAEQKWADGAAVYKQIIDYNENIIDPKFSSLFDGTNESSKEIIFATQYQQDLGPNSMLLHMYPAALGGYHLSNPLGNLAESYEFNDGTPFSFTDPRYNPADLGQNRDPRLKYTLLYNGQLFKNIIYDCHPDHTSSPDQLTTSKQATRTGFAPRKFLAETFGGSNLANSGIDLPIIRYAEVLLSYLECQLEAGSAIDQTLLDATINKVRGRADVSMPKVTETNPANLRTILRRERRNELALEGIRLWDLLRWKIAGTVLKGNFYGAAYPGATNLRKNGTTVDPYSRWFVTSKNFRTGQDELWPIPLSEVSINPNLK